MAKQEEFSPDIKISALVDHPISLRLKTDGSDTVSYMYPPDQLHLPCD